MEERGFENIAAQYDESRMVPTPVLAEGLRRVLKSRLALGTGGTALDCGAGTGQVSAALLHLGFAVVGVDLSPRMLALAKERCGRLGRFRAVLGDVCHLPFAPRHFDVVISGMLLDHVPEWRTGVAEMRRVLRDGGALLFIFSPGIMRSTPRSRFMELVKARGARVGTRGATKQDLLDHLRETGARVTVTDGENAVSWTVERPVRQSLEDIKSRLYSIFWDVPEDMYAAALRDLEASLAPMLREDVVERNHARLECWEAAFPRDAGASRQPRDVASD